MDIEKIAPRREKATVAEMLKAEFRARFVDPDGRVKDGLLVERDCPLCGGAQTVPLFVKDRLRYVRCACGMVFISPNLRPEIRAEWYETSEAYSWFYRELVLKKRAERIAEIWLPRRRFILGLGCPLEAILDVGCGCGEFIEVMAETAGARLGVEPNRAAVEIARRHVGDTVIQGTLDAVAARAGSFTLVTLWEVLHHFDAPLAAVKRIWELLKPGGYLVLQSPNFDGFDYRLLGPRHHDVQFGIPNYFDVGTMRRLLIAGGFESSSIAVSTPGKLDVDYVLRAMNRDGPAAVADGLWRSILERIAAGNARLKDDLQALLQAHGLSGSMRLTARKQA